MANCDTLPGRVMRLVASRTARLKTVKASPAASVSVAQKPRKAGGKIDRWKLGFHQETRGVKDP